MIKSTRAIVLAMVMSFAAVACAPSGGQESPAGAADQVESALPAAGEAVAQEVSATGTVDVLLPAPVGQVVDVTPMSAAELAAQPPGQTQGGPGEADKGQAGGENEPDEPEALPAVGSWPIYADDAFAFRVAYPPDFIVRQADAARLVGLIPAPMAAVYFMSPATAESALAGTDAPDLEVRVFETGPVTSLADWLASVGVTADQTQTATQLGALPGVEVCGTTMVFPNCSTFVAANDRVYQLRVLTLEGEAMGQSFVPMP